MSKENPIQIIQYGIKCDNVACDWRDDSVTPDQYQQWLNKPCPKCGDNLLNEQDYQNSQFVHSLVKVLDGKSEAELDELTKALEQAGFRGPNISHLDPNKEVNVTIETHGHPRITKITQSDEPQI